MRVGFFSSSTPITAISPIRFKRAKEFLESKNITLVAGNLTGQSDHYRSGSIKKRAEEFNQLVHDDSLDILMATIGGLNTNAILPLIDFQYLEKHPKTIVGYSDATALLLAITVKAPSCKVLYGPALVASFGEFAPIVEETFADFEQIIANQTATIQAPKVWTDESVNWNDFEHPKMMHQNHWGFVHQSVLEGTIKGGNLDTMAGIIGSPYFPQFNHDDILFIEDAEKDAAIVEKNFAMLNNAGVFDQVKGIVLGKHAQFDDLNTGRKPIQILQEILGTNPVPIIYDYDSCHTVPMMTTPLGAHAIIDAEKMTVTFSEY